MIDMKDRSSLERLLRPLRRDLNAEFAAALLRMQADAEVICARLIAEGIAVASPLPGCGGGCSVNIPTIRWSVTSPTVKSNVGFDSRGSGASAASASSSPCGGRSSHM
jgi:hypothetical protein